MLFSVHCLVRTILELGWPYTRSSGVARTRAILDLVSDAIEVGILSLFCLEPDLTVEPIGVQRGRRLRASKLTIRLRRERSGERLGALTGQLSANVQFVFVDFENDDLESRLIQAGLDPAWSGN
jgi:hypothetical protein